MIIFGTRYTHKKTENGTFECPCCQASADFEVRRPRKWFHLYWIPIIPLATYEPLLECKNCHRQMPPVVAPRNLTKEITAIHNRIARGVVDAAALVAIRAEDAPECRVGMISDTPLLFGGDPLESEDAERALSIVETDDPTMEDILKPICENVTDAFKEALLGHLFCIISRGRGMTRETLSLLTDAGMAMEMSPVHIRGVLRELFEKEQERKNIAA